MGLYISDEDVKVRLVGKVRFTDDPADENKMSLKLLRRLIKESEGQLHLDLSPRYDAPFSTVDAQGFAQLPDATREVIKTLNELLAVIRVLETDFGEGTATDGAKYCKTIQDRYDKVLGKLLEQKKDGLGWKYPPLPKLSLSYMNTEADDGFAGQVLTTNTGTNGGFPEGQINNPSLSFFTGVWD